MGKLKKEYIKIVEIMTRYGVDLNKTSVEDFIRNQLDYTIPFLQNFNANITKLESLTEAEIETIVSNWLQSSAELKKAMDNVRTNKEV
jgi:hypothetical protein